MNNIPIHVQGLTKDYGQGRGIFDVTFSVEEGHVFGFLGSNGAGKTVTMRHLMGFIRPQAGSARILGMDCFQEHAQIQQHLGYLPGELAIYEDMTALEYLKLINSMRGSKNNKRTDELIDYFELNPRMNIRKMSKGNKQKVGLIAAFMNKPEILLLDEPSSGLDPLMQARFIELVLAEKQRGATIFLSSHIFEEIERSCDRVAFIRNGRLTCIKDMEDVNNQRRHAFRVRFETQSEQKRFLCEQAQALHLPNNQASAYNNSTELLIWTDGNVDFLIKTLAHYCVCDLVTQEQSLEKMFMGYYGEGDAQ